MTTLSRSAVPAALILALSLVGCSTDAPPHQEPAPVSTTEAPPVVEEPVAEEAPAAGTRENPIPIDTVTEFDPDSMWRFSVGATDPDATAEVVANFMPEPKSGSVYITTEFYVQAKDPNGNPDGADPWSSMDVTYVTAKGNSFSATSGVCSLQGGLYDVGAMYPGAESTATLCTEVPSDAVSGGAWRVGSLVRSDSFIFLQGAS